MKKTPHALTRLFTLLLASLTLLFIDLTSMVFGFKRY